ncbi:MAG: hypothetical protein WCX30_00140 [Candidatus Paceibacterota bacterium]|nr:hypothetical protein [bacterium]
MSINFVEKFDVVVNSQDLLRIYLRMGIATILDFQKEIAVKITQKDDGLFMISIIGAKLPEKGKKNSHFNGNEPWEIFHSKEDISAGEAAIKYILNFINENRSEWLRKKIASSPTNQSRDSPIIALGYQIEKKHLSEIEISINYTQVEKYT